MAAIIAPVAAAGAGFISSMMMNSTNKKIAREQMDFQEDMVRNQMRFQKDMSNTAYRRAVADMKAAGINPMLAYTQGGASSPQGSSAVGARRDYKAPLGEVIQNLIAARQATASIKQTEAQTAYIRAQTRIENSKIHEAVDRARRFEKTNKSSSFTKDVVDAARMTKDVLNPLNFFRR